MPRRLLVSIVTVTSLFAVTGCGIGEAVIAHPGAEAKAVLDDALDDLGQRPSLSYTGTIARIDGEHDAASVRVDVSRAGSAYGKATISGTRAKIMAADGISYVSADKRLWKSDDASARTAAKIGHGWSPVDPDEWFAPGSELAPKKYAATLKTVLRNADAFDSWLPSRVDRHGKPCYPVPVGKGTVFVGAESPHTIVGVKHLTVPHGDSHGANATLDLDVSTVAKGALSKWYGELRGAVGKLSTVHAQGDIGMSISSDYFNCAYTTCYFYAYLDTSDLGDGLKVAKKVTAEFHGIAKATSAGTEDCYGKVTVKVGSGKLAHCTVTFHLSGGSQTVKPTWESSGLLTFHPDTKRLKAHVASELKDLT